MLVQNVEFRIQQLKEQKTQLEKEVADLLKCRDKALEDIRVQRYWSTEVVTKKNNEQKKLDHMTDLVISIDNELKSKKFNYSNTTERQIEIVNKFNLEIQDLSDRLIEIKKLDTNISDLKKQRYDTKANIDLYKTELSKLDITIKRKEKEIVEKEEELENRELSLITRENKVDMMNRQLITRTSKLDLKEKRLKKLKKELFSKK